MTKTKNKQRKFRKKLTDKYRLVILNEDTFEERFSIKLSRLNVFVSSGLFSIILIVGTILLIAFTPIKEYIPGYSSTKLKKQARNLVFESDSLKARLAMLEQFTAAIKPVLTGEIKGEEQIDSIQEESKRVFLDSVRLNATEEESLFREKVEEKNRFSVSENITDRAKVVFFAPITGTISQTYNANNKHFALDIVAKTGAPIKAIADGTVIFSEWTIGTGYVIILKHASNFVSVYKHNGALLKQQGDLVKSGEVIASVGSTGELTTGPHLHFELWSNGYAVNPLNYIDFK